MIMSFNTPINDWSSQRVWIVGASSGIGAAVANQLLAQGSQVALSARRKELLEQVAGTYPNALILPMDASNEEAWKSTHQKILSLLGGIDLLLFCAANYRFERTWQVDPTTASHTFEINVGSMYKALATVLPTMLQNGRGGIGVIASVAGYVGLPNASVYGPTKAALINLAEILYGDLHRKGINVYLINPGFVDTPLTQTNQFKMPALQTPENAAIAILNGISKGKFEIHFPYRFTMVLKFIQLLPYRLRFFLLKRVA
jgi:short-subunit dehydrogenase